MSSRPPEFAHRQRPQLDRLAVFASETTVSIRERSARRGNRDEDRRIGKVGQFSQGFVKVGTAEQIAPKNTNEFCLPQRPQHRL